MKYNLKIIIVILLMVSSIANAQNNISNKILVEYTVQRGITFNKERLIAVQDKAIYIRDSLFFERDKDVEYAEFDEETLNITIKQKTIKSNQKRF